MSKTTPELIVKAWAHLRKTNSDIPDETLDFMKNSALLELQRQRINEPIIYSCFVSDFTFAVRFKYFLKNIRVNDVVSLGELEYMNRVADKLIELQVNTVTDEWQRDYLNDRMINGF